MALPEEMEIAVPAADTTPPPARRLGAAIRAAAIVVAAACLLVVLGVAGMTERIPQAVGSMLRGSAGRPMTADDAVRISRLVEVAFEDAERQWAHAFRSEGGLPYMPSAIKLFTQPTATPCGGAQPTAGPFYCGRDGLVSFDLQFIHMVQTKLAAEADEATVVLVGQTVAAKVQQSLGGFSPASVRPGDARAAGLARQADCFAGVWARRAQQALPKATPELYGRLLLAERSVVQGMQGDERLLPASHTLIMEGEIADRESAYERGYAAGQQGSCPAT